MLYENNVIVIGFAGIISVGKSTALRRLCDTQFLQKEILKRKKQSPKKICIAWMLEPTDVWEKSGWLTEFYKDPDENALWFQFGVFNSHVDKMEEFLNVRKPDEILVIIVERTMYCQRLFWQVQVDLQRAKKQEDEVYQLIWNKWRRFEPEPRLIFFFKTSTIDIAMDRIEKRNRKAETDNAGNGVTREYQEMLLEKHEQWYTQPMAHPPGAPAKGIRCVHITTDQPFHEDDVALQELAGTIAAHLICLLK